MTSNAAAAERHPGWWVPNALTISRILIIPILIAGIIGFGNGNGSPFANGYLLFFLIFYAMASDFLDGFLARRWKLVSGFGRMIDPIADKLLVAGCLIAFCIAVRGEWIIVVPAIAIIFRDILVSGGREHAALSGRAMPPTKLAKWKTSFEFISIVVLLFWVMGLSYLEIDSAIPSIKANVKLAGVVLLWISAAMSVWTGQLYVRAALKD
jgi:CDP-diacylglycerol--glycerol-3-phosphate 3-phosphatidyltransferase